MSLSWSQQHCQVGEAAQLRTIFPSAQLVVVECEWHISSRSRPPRSGQYPPAQAVAAEVQTTQVGEASKLRSASHPLKLVVAEVSANSRLKRLPSSAGISPLNSFELRPSHSRLERSSHLTRPSVVGGDAVPCAEGSVAQPVVNLHSSSQGPLRRRGQPGLPGQVSAEPEAAGGAVAGSGASVAVVGASPDSGVEGVGAGEAERLRLIGGRLRAVGQAVKAKGPQLAYQAAWHAPAQVFVAEVLTCQVGEAAQLPAVGLRSTCFR